MAENRPWFQLWTSTISTVATHEKDSTRTLATQVHRITCVVDGAAAKELGAKADSFRISTLVVPALLR